MSQVLKKTLIKILVEGLFLGEEWNADFDYSGVYLDLTYKSPC